MDRRNDAVLSEVIGSICDRTDSRTEEPMPHPPSSNTSTERRDPAQLARVEKAISTHSFCTVATVSTNLRPHVAGVVYDSTGTRLYVHTMRSSRKARNIAAHPYVAVTIPVRKLPVGPPFTITFQGTAEVLDMDDPHILELLERRQLGKISGHGALDEPDGCFLRIVPNSTIHSYGIGTPILDVIRDPLHNGARSVELG